MRQHEFFAAQRRWRTDLVSKLALNSKPAMAPPKVWNPMYRMHRGNVASRPKNVAMVMVGLRCAPETGPVAKMNKGRTRIAVSPPSRLGTSAPVAKVLRSVTIRISANKGAGKEFTSQFHLGPQLWSRSSIPANMFLGLWILISLAYLLGITDL